MLHNSNWEAFLLPIKKKNLLKKIKTQNTCLQLGLVDFFLGSQLGEYLHQRYKVFLALPSEMRSGSCSVPQSNVT